MLSNAERLTSWVKTRSRREIKLLIAGSIVVVAVAAWGLLTYWNGANEKAELLTYRLCVGSQRELCPKDAAFVRDEGEETVPRWAQRQCASYKRRRIIISDAPAECACQIAGVTCSSE
jgi:hypothetical protein